MIFSIFALKLIKRKLASDKPTKPKGTRDFGPIQMARRNYLLDIVKDVFKKYGFLPLETPAIENLSVLMGKYGNEGDQLLFKIINSGDFLSKVDNNLSEVSSESLLPQIAEKGLRYDLTVPFARYVVMNRNDINFPFRRYQVQPVWRADRPQKGRYREFLQCDADVIGTDSLLCEAEIILMLTEIFAQLNLVGFEIAINSRKILTGISEYLGQPGKEAQLCVAIDKLDKIGLDKVFEELKAIDFSDKALENLGPILSMEGTTAEKIISLSAILTNTEVGLEGVNEIDEVIRYVKGMQGDLSNVTFDPSLARGLSYYTGTIFEVRMKDGSIGSISGGGRYDNLTGVFGMPDVSGVGISLGIERIYDVLEARGLFPNDSTEATKALIINFGQENSNFALETLSTLRNAGISTELYPESSKMKKQMNYADRNGIPYVIIAGNSELEAEKVTIKNMSSGEQTSVPSQGLLPYFTKL